MPGKSKHSRGKHPHRNKIRQHPQGTGIQQQAAQESPKPAAVPARVSSSPGPKANTPATTMTVIEQSYVVGDIKRIGILTGIIIVVLIILAIIFK
jgi:hypothetical protein